MHIYKNQYGWSLMATNDYNGKKMKCYVPISFKKGIEPNGDKANIEITKFIPSCYEGKNGIQFKMFVSEYVVVADSKKEEPKPEANEPYNENKWGKNPSINNDSITSDDLPWM